MWELIRVNKQRAALLVAGETLLLALTGFVIGGAVAPGGMYVGALVGIAIAAGLFSVAYFAGDQALLSLTGARELKPDSKNTLWNVVEEMKIASGLPAMPRVFVIEDEVPNAFACGRSPEKSAIAVTTGLLKRLNRDELQGVIGHEIAHVVHRDILYMTLVSVMVGAVALLAHIYLRSLWYGGVRTRTSRRDGGGQALFALLAVLFAVLAPIVAQLVYLAVSRRREYLADAGSAVFTRYPEGLASALQKISQRQAPMQRTSPALAPLYIVPPGTRALSGKASSLWSTHPPTEKRIAVLRAIGSGVSYKVYQETLSRIAGEGRVLPASLTATAGTKPVRKPAEQKEPALRHRDVTDLLWAAQGFRFHRCSCGLTFKVPPKRRGSFSCPRCKRELTLRGAAR